jgi:hypothetical protein
MHVFLIIMRDAALFFVGAILVLLFMSLLGAMSQSTSFLASFPAILLGPFLPVLSRLGINVLDWYSANPQAGSEGAEIGFRTARNALDYLANRIVDEAKLEDSPLSEIERKMLYFSETDSGLRDPAKVSAEFERTCDPSAYERKISSLIRRITTRDQRQDPAAHAAWNDAVLKLCDGDYYLLVLIDPGLVDTSGSRPAHDILRLWLTAFGIVFGGLVLMVIGNWLFGQGFFLHWLHQL